MISRILTIVIVILTLLLGFSLFKNIGHPLLWNDEAETVIYAERILRFGYPKVNDGKNIANDTEVPDKGVGVNEKYDAWIYLTWGQYYLGVPSVLLARLTPDPFLKTALLRIPFTALGLIGILLFSFLPGKFVKNKIQRKIITVVFLFLEILSVPLVLHLREFRSYSLTVFFSAVIIQLYFNYRFSSFNKWIYYLFIPILLFLLFNIFFPAYLVLTSVLVLFQTELLIKELDGKNIKFKTLFLSSLRLYLPLLISFLSIIPLLYFFEIPYVSSQVNSYFHNSIYVYLDNLGKVAMFYLQYDFLGLLLFIKILLWLVKQKFRKIVFAENDLVLKKLSGYLFAILIIYPLIVAKVPYFFERYYLVMQPLISLILAIDLLRLWNVFTSKKTKELFIYLLVTVFVFSMIPKINVLGGHVYELGHTYRGPLDYLIYYIKDNFKNSEKLVIATNYEEYVYMYYLGSKVTVGYVGNNLQADAQIVPDMIIPRLGRPNNLALLNSLLQKNRYRKVTFPVYDYLYNNIPALSLPDSHLFKTKLADNEQEKLTLYIKQTE